MEITYKLEKLLTNMTLDSARGRVHPGASGQARRDADKQAWAEYYAIKALLGDTMDTEITVDYPDPEE